MRVELLTGASADETTSRFVDVSHETAITLYVKGTGTISAGVLTIEEADYGQNEMPPSACSAIGTVALTAVTDGAQLAYHIGGPGGVFAYGSIRVRISTAVSGGGSVSVVLRAV